MVRVAPFFLTHGVHVQRCYFLGRPMVSDGCPVCLSVTLLYCRQTVGWIKMKLGMEVGLGPGHIVLDGDLQLPLP